MRLIRDEGAAFGFECGQMEPMDPPAAARALANFIRGNKSARQTLGGGDGELIATTKVCDDWGETNPHAPPRLV